MSQVVIGSPIINVLPQFEQPDDNQPNLFADLNGEPSDFERKVDFCEREQSWSTRLMSNYKLSNEG